MKGTVFYILILHSNSKIITELYDTLSCLSREPIVVATRCRSHNGPIPFKQRISNDATTFNESSAKKKIFMEKKGKVE